MCKFFCNSYAWLNVLYLRQFSDVMVTVSLLVLQTCGSFMMLAIIFLVCNLWLATATPFHTSAMKCDILDKNARFDCHPDPGASPSRCASRGCCWLGSEFSSMGGIDYPYCFFPTNYDGYIIAAQKETDYGYQAILSRASPSGWPNDVQTLTLDVWMETNERLHFKVCYTRDNIYFKCFRRFIVIITYARYPPCYTNLLVSR
jgi:hypothetical protein